MFKPRLMSMMWRYVFGTSEAFFAVTFLSKVPDCQTKTLVLNSVQKYTTKLKNKDKM
jgi:hypothetical protein